MIETIIAILFLLGIVLVATGPKSSDKKGKDSGGSSLPREMRVFDAAEVREPDLCGIAAGSVAFEQRQSELDLLAVPRVLGEK